jgi:hypothetical protein
MIWRPNGAPFKSPSTLFLVDMIKLTMKRVWNFKKPGEKEKKEKKKERKERKKKKERKKQSKRKKKERKNTDGDS